MTAKLVRTSYVATLYFSANNVSYGTVSQDVAYIADWRDIDTVDGEIRVIPTAISGYKFVDWGYKIPGSSLWERIPSEYISNNHLLLNNSQAENVFIDGTKFMANFIAISGGGGEMKYTVIIRAAEWSGSQWFVSSDANYGIGWLNQAQGTTNITKQFNKGEVCTFWYGNGSSSSGGYEPISITDIDGTTVGNINSKGQYSFTVTKDVVYYVKYAYIRND